jgi:hypothetical protein
MQSMITNSGMHDSLKKPIINALQQLRKESISQAGRALARRLVPHRQYQDHSSWEFFTHCYAVRSQILHGGRAKNPSIDMLALANHMEAFVSDLLLASLGDAA